MRTIYLMVFMLVFAVGAYAQTVDVPGTYATIQAAIDSFSGDVTPEDNVVRITTVGPYAEVITLTYPVTIRGDVGGGARPIILAQSNGGDGIVVNNGSPYNGLENLIILPDRTTSPTDDGVWVTAAGTECSLDNVLICPNNGSDQPVSTDGLSLPDLTGATFFPDEVLYVSTGAIVHATDTILTANVAPGTGHDLMLISGSAGAGSTINKGCIFSFSSRYGAQINNGVTIRGTVDEPVVFAYSGFEPLNSPYTYTLGIFGGGTYALENVIFIGSDSDGLQVYDTVVGDTNALPSITHCAFVSSGNYGLNINTGTVPTSISECTFVGNTNVLINSDPDVTITATDCIFAGTGTLTANSIVNAASPATMTLTNCAVVQAGPYSVAAVTDAILVNVINDDPLFANIADWLDPSFLDVYNGAYGAAGSGGAPLSGYGDYAAGPTPTPTITPIVAGTGTNWKDYR